MRTLLHQLTFKRTIHQLTDLFLPGRVSILDTSHQPLHDQDLKQAYKSFVHACRRASFLGRPGKTLFRRGGLQGGTIDNASLVEACTNRPHDGGGHHQIRRRTERGSSRVGSSNTPTNLCLILEQPSPLTCWWRGKVVE